MHFLSRLWRLLRGADVDASQHSRFLDAGTDFQHSRVAASGSSDSQKAVRKDLLRMVLRTTLHRNGIPTEWIGADALTAASRENVPGLHVRFVVRHWDPRIGLHAPALQEDFARRLLAFDPLSAGWLRGYSWRYDLPEGTPYPALPHPGSWTAPPSASARAQPWAEPVAAHDPIISGPVLIGGGGLTREAAPEAPKLRRGEPRPIRAPVEYVVTQPSPLAPAGRRAEPRASPLNAGGRPPAQRAGA